MSDGVTGLGYFGGSGQAIMVNFRFGWAVDPGGNRFQLWEPAEGM